MWPVTAAGLVCASQPWIPRVVPFLPRSRQPAAAALCWASCGLALSFCRGAGRRVISDVELFHFGLCGAAGAAVAVAVAAAAMLAVLALARTGAAGPRLHEDNGAVIFWAEVGAVWRTVVKTWSGKLDLKIDENEDESGVEGGEYGAREAKCQWRLSEETDVNLL